MTKVGDMVRVVGAGAPGFAKMGEELRIVRVEDNIVDAQRSDGDSARFDMTESPVRLELIPNVRPCGICGEPADRYGQTYQCRANQGHVADTMTGIFSDCTYPRRTTPGEFEPVCADSAAAERQQTNGMVDRPADWLATSPIVDAAGEDWSEEETSTCLN